MPSQHYPLASITMLSNSRTQKDHIDRTAKEKGFNNVEVITGDVNTYDFEEKGRYVRRDLTGAPTRPKLRRRVFLSPLTPPRCNPLRPQLDSPTSSPSRCSST